MATTGLEGFLAKLEVTNEIGEALDKQLQQAENSAQQFLGGAAALKAGSVKVGALGAHVDKDLNEGKLKFSNELEVASYVKSYLRKAGELLLNLSEKSKSEELVSHGKVAAIRESLDVVGRHCKSAKSRAEQIIVSKEKASEEVRRGSRSPGEHPGPSSLDERRVERDAAQAKAPRVSSSKKITPLPEKTMSLSKVSKHTKSRGH